MQQRKLLFLTLNTFSSTGGIETVCRIASKAFHDIAVESGYFFSMHSMYDHPAQIMERYLPNEFFTGFSGKRLSFIKRAVDAGVKCETVVLSHINLLVVGFLIKVLSPKTKVLLIAHGIEVWKPVSRWKKVMLQTLDTILPVSDFTRNKMQSLYGLAPGKFKVLNNCLDPFLQPVTKECGKEEVRNRFGFAKDDLLLLTLTRLKSSEQYKGYDKVISALPEVLKRHPTAKYLIAGKYDAAEKERLDLLITRLGLQRHVVFAGFVADKDLPGLFCCADAYIMPSKGEGFGIVFIEALYYGLPVIAGNVDGSVDAVDKGKLGMLVNPDSQDEIVSAICSVFENNAKYQPEPLVVHTKYGFPAYKHGLQAVLGMNNVKMPFSQMPT